MKRSSTRGEASSSSTTKRPRRAVAKPRSLSTRLALWLLGVGLAAAGLAALGAGGVVLYYALDPRLPRLSSIRDYQPRKVTSIVDRRGRLIGELALERRTVVPIERIPKLLIQAVVAAEDKDFFHHRGLDYWGILRAVLTNLRAGRLAQGGSTITQQVVKTFFLSPERTIRRKVQEAILSQRIERLLNKEEILCLYLNQIYFGHGRYGVQEASHFFFDRDVEQLGVAECALLAGLPQSPERLSPLKHPEAAKQRQSYVLGRMAEQGVISTQVAQRLIEEPIRLHRRRYPFFNVSPELNDVVRSQLEARYGETALASLGVHVQTTLDATMQQQAREAVQWGLRAIDARQHYARPLQHIAAAERTRYVARLRQKQATWHDGQDYKALVLGVDDARQVLALDLGLRRADVDISAARYNPDGWASSRRFAVGDVVRVRAVGQNVVFDPGPQAALVALDPRSGDVLALLGGYEQHSGDLNRALLARRQPGSAFKPFVYAAALETGQFTAATLVDDAPVVYKGWTPQNFDHTFRGRLRLRVALAHSVNTVAVRLIEQLGIDPVRQLAARLGIDSPLGNDLSLALGSSGVRPLELCAAYAAFANGGKRITPRYVLRVGAKPAASASAVGVLRPEVAYLMESLLSSVVLEGTGQTALRLARPVAGKTGTTDDQKDAWFVGFTPQLVVATWVGFDRPRSLGQGESGSRVALAIWVRFMREALRGQPKLPFVVPTGIVTRRIDAETGLLATAQTEQALDEVFIEGTEPQQAAPTPTQVDPGAILMGPTTP